MPSSIERPQGDKYARMRVFFEDSPPVEHACCEAVGRLGEREIRILRSMARFARKHRNDTRGDR